RPPQSALGFRDHPRRVRRRLHRRPAPPPAALPGRLCSAGVGRVSCPIETGTVRGGHGPSRRPTALTVGSPRSGQTAAVLFSFTSTCQRLGVGPWAYLQDVLTRLPTAPAGQLGDLLPDHWQAARQVSRAIPPASTSEKPPPAAQSAS